MAKKKAPAKAGKKAKKLPRQSALPGMEDAKIAAIENLAMDYCEFRDERLRFNQQEVDLKEKIIAAMHKAGKMEYRRDGISVVVKVEKEGIKVRVRDEDETPKPKKAAKEIETEQEEDFPEQPVDADVEVEAEVDSEVGA